MWAHLADGSFYSYILTNGEVCLSGNSGIIFLWGVRPLPCTSRTSLGFFQENPGLCAVLLILLQPGHFRQEASLTSVPAIFYFFDTLCSIFFAIFFPISLCVFVYVLYNYYKLPFKCQPGCMQSCFCFACHQIHVFSRAGGLESKSRVPQWLWLNLKDFKLHLDSFETCPRIVNNLYFMSLL